MAWGAEHFIEDDIRAALRNYPIRSQEGLRKDAKVIARFFGGAFTFYLLEGSDCVLYGVCDTGDGFYYSFLGFMELENLNMWGGFRGVKIERDIGVPLCKMTLGECMTAYHEHLGA